MRKRRRWSKRCEGQVSHEPPRQVGLAAPPHLCHPTPRAARCGCPPPSHRHHCAATTTRAVLLAFFLPFIVR
ncbi:hypothetical protein E2C01_057979 [Portunus trituberculatus]|uniref:Uncharacterized protein n=1 Tax=Portunus trituberculatus TaxID=210409 RepID=A0A5B7GUE3_PORTR|nr:hypothetical protein [Portunus trituberculatus]